VESVKRAFDLILTIPTIVIISPLLGLIALSIRLTLGSPVLFCQVRPGLHGKPFTIYKFRTMTGACDAQGDLLPDAQFARVNRGWGRWQLIPGKMRV